MIPSPPHRPAGGQFALSGRHQLLLQAALGTDERSVAAYEQWRIDIDIRQIDLASQRLVPHLVSTREALGFDGGDPLIEQFRKVTRFTWLKTQFLIAQCEQLAAALGDAAIPAMVLKGAAVVHHTGGDVGLRPMDDIDIAVPFAELQAAFEVAAGAGFVPEGPCPSPAELAAMAKGFHALGARNPAGALVDIHWHVLPGSLHPEADGELWRGAVPARLGRADCLATGREDSIVHAVAHAARPEADPTLRWAADVAMLVRTAPGPGIDWDRVMAQAGRHRLRVPMGDALEVIRQVVGVPVPRQVITELRRSPVPVLERLEAWPRLDRHGRRRRPALPEQLIDAYQGFVRRRVRPGERPGVAGLVGFLGEWWDQPSTRRVAAHACFVAAGRPWGCPLPARWSTAERLVDPTVVELGQRVEFGIGGEGRRYLGVGWSFPEPHGTWTMGREAAVRMRIAGGRRGSLALCFVLIPFVVPERPRLGVDVIVNGRRVARWQFVGHGWMSGERRVELGPEWVGQSGLLDIRLVIDRPLTPESVGYDTGNRPLGISLHALTVEVAEAGGNEGRSLAQDR